MTAPVVLVAGAVRAWPARDVPDPAGAAGLALALLVVLVLVVHQLRPGWRDRSAPGPVQARMPVPEVEWRALHWTVATVLLLALGVVVVERVVVLT